MKLSNCNPVNFSALLGKKEVTRIYSPKGDFSHTIQHVYPFKDEFCCKEEAEAKIRGFESTPSFKRICNEANFGESSGKIVIEDELPFTKADFIVAKKVPSSPYVSKEALAFINSDDYNTTITKDVGLCTNRLIEEGNLNTMI